MIALLLLAVQAPPNTRAFLVIQRGQVVHESYAPGNDPARRQGTASLAKALLLQQRAGRSGYHRRDLGFLFMHACQRPGT